MILLVQIETNEGLINKIIKGDICYHGSILKPKQIEMLKKYHNTVINENLLEVMGKKELLAEIENLTGVKCYVDIVVKDNDTTVLIKRVPDYVLDSIVDEEYYILFDHDVEVRRFSKTHYTKDRVKQTLKNQGYKAIKEVY